MSKAKKTKRAKKYSATHLYRHIGEVMNHAKKELEANNARPIPSSTDTSEPARNASPDTEKAHLTQVNRPFTVPTKGIFKETLTVNGEVVIEQTVVGDLPTDRPIDHVWKTNDTGLVWKCENCDAVPVTAIDEAIKSLS